MPGWMRPSVLLRGWSSPTPLGARVVRAERTFVSHNEGKEWLLSLHECSVHWPVCFPGMHDLAASYNIDCDSRCPWSMLRCSSSVAQGHDCDARFRSLGHFNRLPYCVPRVCLPLLWPRDGLFDSSGASWAHIIRGICLLPCRPPEALASVTQIR